MGPQTATGTILEPLPATSLSERIDRSAALKQELVGYALSPRFGGQLGALLEDAADRHGHLDDPTTVLTIDHFALQHRLANGRTVVEQFVAQRRPRLSDEDRALVLGWLDVIDGCFEVVRIDGSSVLLHNLLDDVVYRV